MSSHGEPPCSIRLTSLEDKPAAVATAAWETPDAFLAAADLVAEICEQASAATGATGRVRLGHPHILTECAHLPIYRTATIAS